MIERILLMGPPGSGKTKQLLNVCNYVTEKGKKFLVMDLEDKFEAMLVAENVSLTKENLGYWVSFEWDNPDADSGILQIRDKIMRIVKPGDWIAIDRVDLAWVFVQRWYTRTRFKESLADVLTNNSKALGKKAAMVIPRFDQGSWTVINEQYDSFISDILYKSRCNILLTSGVTVPENEPINVFGNLKILPRGQKELAHQPHSAFLLEQKREGRKELVWSITTAKDLSNREKFDEDPIYDFAYEYLDKYYKVG